MADSNKETAAPAATIPRTKEKLEELENAAALQYSLKNFVAAADFYADAVEIQAELNGEMVPENAELLFYYGRALYKVAIAKSDVLGGRVAQEENSKAKALEKKAKKEAGAGSSTTTNGGSSEKQEETAPAKPYFQLTGDENWTDSEDEEEAEAEVEEEDDFQNAFETFEIARVLYGKKLEELEASEDADKGKGKAELTPQARALKEKLADCHGFLVEIALENERFHDAISDARAQLEVQEELYPFEHENVTEAHYSLSLALEFASVRKAPELGDATAGAEAQTEDQEQEIDYEMRKDAAKHTELAIQSLEARLKKENEGLSSGHLSETEKKEKEDIVKDKKEILEDMKQRLLDLQVDPKSQAFDSVDPSVFQGLLGGLIGADAATQKAKLEEATKSANDISGLVKTRKKEKAPVPATASSATNDASGGKRKLDVADDATNGKRAKTDELQ